MSLICLAIIGILCGTLLAIYKKRPAKKKRIPEVYSVSLDTPLPLIDGFFVFNGDQIYYPENRHRYLASGDEWIDISENFRGLNNE